MSACPVGNTTLGQIIGRKFNGDFIASQDPDVVLAHLAGNMRSDNVSILQFDSEHGIRERFGDRPFHFYVFFFSHKTNCTVLREARHYT
jgi:hypothetical protein